MKKVIELNETLGNIDIYLLDQIMKGRYAMKDKILDAGCGGGRNLIWLDKNGYDIYGIDPNQSSIQSVRQMFESDPDHFRVETIEKASFAHRFFDHIICNAVLHFASNDNHFFEMFARLVAMLNTGGSLFIRTTSNIGIEEKVIPLQKGLHKLPDGTHLFLITRSIVDQLVKKHQLHLIEPVKSVIVDDLRSMTTLVLMKS